MATERMALGLTLLGIALIGGCKSGEGGTCHPAGDDCKAGLHCIETRCVTQEQGNRRCAAQEGCRQKGLCTLLRAGAAELTCVAASDADCERSAACANAGECTARQGRCVLASDAGCRKRKACADWGECSFREGKGCVAGTDKDCAASDVCKRSGYCSASEGACIARDDADCRRSQACKDRGTCSAVKGHCVARNDADCARSTGCERAGRCSVDREQPWKAGPRASKWST